MKKILTKEVRRWVYGLAIAAVPILIHYEVMDVEAGPIVLPFILALLNLSPDEPEQGYLGE